MVSLFTTLLLISFPACDIMTLSFNCSRYVIFYYLIDNSIVDEYHDSLPPRGLYIILIRDNVLQQKSLLYDHSKCPQI